MKRQKTLKSCSGFKGNEKRFFFFFFFPCFFPHKKKTKGWRQCPRTRHWAVDACRRSWFKHCHPQWQLLPLSSHHSGWFARTGWAHDGFKKKNKNIYFFFCGRRREGERRGGRHFFFAVVLLCLALICWQATKFFLQFGSFFFFFFSQE